jgi:hypothetical protein
MRHSILNSSAVFIRVLIFLEQEGLVQRWKDVGPDAVSMYQERARQVNVMKQALLRMRMNPASGSDDDHDGDCNAGNSTGGSWKTTIRLRARTLGVSKVIGTDL